MSERERFQYAAHVGSWLEWRWYLYRAAGAEEPDDEWRARIMAGANGMGPVAGPPTKEWLADLARFEIPKNKSPKSKSPEDKSREDMFRANEFRRLWSKIRPDAGPMPPILHRTANEVYEIVQRLIALADKLAVAGVATDDTREFTALLGPTRGRRTTKAAAQKLAALLASGGSSIGLGRGPKSKPLRDKELRGLTALARDFGASGNNGHIDATIGGQFSLGVRRVEGLRTKKNRSRPT